MASVFIWYEVGVMSTQSIKIYKIDADISIFNMFQIEADEHQVDANPLLFKGLYVDLSLSSRYT